MKRVHSFKKLKGRSSSPSSFLLSSSIDESNNTVKGSVHDGHQKCHHGGRPRSVSTVSASSALGLLAATDALLLSRNNESSKIAERGVSVSDTLDGSDMILTSNIQSDSGHQDHTNGVEPCIVPTHLTPLGSAGGPGASGLSNGSGNDVPDGVHHGNSRHTAVENLQQKILKISEQIKIEQASRDDNVAEYLKLSKDADKQQGARIKSVFEKKNQKSKLNVEQLQKKLDNYHRRLREVESNGLSKNQAKYGFKEVGAKLSDLSGGVVDSVRGSLSGLSQVTQNVVNKPKDIASKIKNKFGSADNIPTLKDEEEYSEEGRCNSADDISVTTSSSDYVEPAANHLIHMQQQQHHLTTMKSQMAQMQVQIHKYKDLEIQHDKMKSEIDQIKSQVQRDIGLLTNTIQDERFRCARLEDQLHDLSEMHHRELSDLKQELSSLEEKIEYHAQERARDIQEALESCQTRIAKMEVQQQHQHQQLVTMEGVESATARALLGKLINLLLSVLAVILVFVSTVSSIVMPFFRSQTRMIFTALLVVLLAVLYRNWDSWLLYIPGFGTDR